SLGGLLHRQKKRNSREVDAPLLHDTLHLYNSIMLLFGVVDETVGSG
ncbi:hypothetical protein A2U01_0103391, partial [Trifolium medium]|nr:hypothetical protein [Trifolium medium]